MATPNKGIQTGQLEISLHNGFPVFLPRLLIVVVLCIPIVYLGYLAYSAFHGPEGIPQSEVAVAQQLEPLELIAVIVGLMMGFLFLTMLPVWIIVNYRAARLDSLTTAVLDDLWLCGVETPHLKENFKDFQQQNSAWAFFWPTVFALLPLIVFWWIVLAPHGIFGLYETLLQPVTFMSTGANGARGLDFLNYVNYLTVRATPLTWVFLGTYFYMLSVLIQRWMRSDLTAGLLWRLNARLAIVLIVGLLLNNITLDSATTIPHFALFLAGIVPESAFRWLNLRAANLFKRKNNIPEFDDEAEGIFRSSDLYRIEGLNFWQIDRLMDEGIENIQNLATKDITQMLVRTRFDTQRLLDWIDQALLIHHLGALQISIFRRIYIHTASDFLDAIGLTNSISSSADNSTIPQYVFCEDKLERVCAALQIQSEGIAQVKITKEMLQDLVTSLVQGPNYAFLRTYWLNTSSTERRNWWLGKREKIEKESQNKRLFDIFSSQPVTG